MSQYIGKTISLISNKQLRYVGILESISAEDATIALKSVRSLGTEGRLAQAGSPHLEVAPGTDVYDHVVFKGNDVKDLSVLDIPLDQVKAEVPAQPAQAPQPPQPTATSHQSQAQAPQPTQPPSQAQKVPPTSTKATAATSTQAPATSAAPAASTTTKEAPTKTSVPNATPGTTPEPRGPKPKQKLSYDEDFDFESANAKFAKEVEHEKEASTYNKSSFFDTLSSSTEKGNTMRWGEEKKLNYDTFGETSARGRGGYRGRGRGRGGRGRGNGRGRGRGSYEKKPEWA